MFAVDFARTKYRKGRRGVSATAPIVHAGRHVGTLHDEPEKYVATVDFKTANDAIAFQKLAEKVCKPKKSTEAVSEYARQLLEQAENEYLAK